MNSGFVSHHLIISLSHQRQLTRKWNTSIINISYTYHFRAHCNERDWIEYTECKRLCRHHLQSSSSQGLFSLLDQFTIIDCDKQDSMLKIEKEINNFFPISKTIDKALYMIAVFNSQIQQFLEYKMTIWSLVKKFREVLRFSLIWENVTLNKIPHHQIHFSEGTIWYGMLKLQIQTSRQTRFTKLESYRISHPWSISSTN
jgi:hypothetical protein